MEFSALGAGIRALGDAVPSEVDKNDITRLILHGNLLNTLENSLELPQLAYLNVSSNQLTRLDGRHLSRFSALTAVDAATNRISAVSDIHEIPFLQVLNLSFNCISDLSFLTHTGDGGTISSVPQLERLDLRDNNITTLSQLDQLRYCPSLTMLRLQNAVFDAGVITRNHDNPVCNHPSYVAVVLATCPNLQRLDDIDVEIWRRNLQNYETAVVPMVLHTEQTADIAVEAPSSPRPAADASFDSQRGVATADIALHTPHIDDAERKFLSRLLGRLGGLNAAPTVVSSGVGSASSGSGQRLKQESLDSVDIKIPHISDKTTAETQDSRSPVVDTATAGVSAGALSLTPRSETEMSPSAFGDSTHDTKGALTTTAALKRDGVAANNAKVSAAGGAVGGLPHLRIDGVSLQGARQPTPMTAADADAQYLRNSFTTNIASLRIENKNLRINVESLSRERDSLKADVEKLQLENTVLISKMTLQEDASSALIKSKGRLWEQIEHENYELKREIADKSAAIETLQSEVAARPARELADKLHQRVAELESQLAAAPSIEALRAMQQKQSSLADEVEQVRNDLQSAQYQCRRQATQISDRDLEIQRLREEFAAVKAEATKHAVELAALQSQLDREMRLRTRLEEASRLSQEQLTSVISSTITKKKEAELEVQTLVKTMEDTKAHVAALEKDLARETRQVSTLQDQLEESRKQFDVAITQEQHTCSEAIRVMEKQLLAARKAAEEEIHRLAEDAASKLRVQSHSLRTLGEKCAGLEAESRMACHRKEELESQVHRLELQLDDSFQHNEMLKRALGDAERNLQQLLSSTKAAGVEHVRELEQRLRDQDAEIHSCHKVAAERDNQLQRSTLQVSHLQNELRVKEAMLNDQNDTIKSLKVAATAYKEHMSTCEDQWKQAEADFKRQIQDLRSQCGALMMSRDEAAAECEKASRAAAASRRVTSQMEQLIETLRKESSSIDDLKQQLAAKDAALAFVEREITQIKGAYDAKISIAQVERDEALRNQQDLRAHVQRCNEEKVALEKSCAALEVEAGNLRNAVAHKERELAEVTRRLTSSEAELRVLLHQLDEAKSKRKEQLEKMTNWIMQMQDNPSIDISPIMAARGTAMS